MVFFLLYILISFVPCPFTSALHPCNLPNKIQEKNMKKIKQYLFLREGIKNLFMDAAV